jgi:hypothetical protein
MRGVALALLAIAALHAVHASAAAPASDEAVLSWEPPIQYTTGATLPSSEIASYRIYRGSTSSNLARIAEVPAPATGFTVQDLPTGMNYFAVTAVLKSGAESAYSSIGSKNIVAPLIPNPPTGLTVQQGATAYYVIQQENRFVLLPAGRITGPTQCDEDQQVNGHYAVPRAAVQWFGDVRPLVVVAPCG